MIISIHDVESITIEKVKNWDNDNGKYQSIALTIKNNKASHEISLFGDRIEIENQNEMIRLIECDKCGEWEEMPSHIARWQSQSFEFVKESDDGEAWYQCPKCARRTKSKLVFPCEDIIIRRD